MTVRELLNELSACDLDSEVRNEIALKGDKLFVYSDTPYMAITEYPGEPYVFISTIAGVITDIEDVQT